MIYTYLSICQFVYLSIVYVSICLSVYLFIYLFIYVFIYLSTYLAIYLSVYLPICLSVCLSICLPIYLSIYLSIVHTCRYGLHTKLITYSWGARSEAGESWNMLWKGASTAGFGGCGETPIIKATFFVHSMLEIICISIFTYVYTHTHNTSYTRRVYIIDYNCTYVYYIHILTSTYGCFPGVVKTSPPICRDHPEAEWKSHGDSPTTPICLKGAKWRTTCLPVYLFTWKTWGK